MRVLRELQDDEKPLLLRWRNQPHVAKQMYNDHLVSAEEHDAWFGGIAGDERRKYWTIELNGRCLGLANLFDIDRKNRRTNWAFYLGEVDALGMGIGALAESEVLQYAFGVLQMNKVCCEVLGDNEQVVAMHERFGFKREGLLRSHILKKGVFHDIVCMGLLREEWSQTELPAVSRLRERLSRKNGSGGAVDNARS